MARSRKKAQEIEELRRELFRQWELNHSEHCENNWPHPGDCHWPPPKVLRHPVPLSGLSGDDIPILVAEIKRLRRVKIGEEPKP